MSAASEDLHKKMRTVLNTPWVTRSGTVVPKTDDVSLTNGAVKLQAAYLYTDMRDSTLLAKRYTAEFAAKVIRMYLQGSVAIIRAQGGHIRSFDGDRVMGIFIGDSRRNSAVAAGLRINWLVGKAINPLLKRRAATSNSTEWQVAHCTGIDEGEAFIVRGGARDNSDLVSIGKAPNLAAKLSAIRGGPPLIVTSRIYDSLTKKNKHSDGGAHMWKGPGTRQIGPYVLTTYSCSWTREP